MAGISFKTKPKKEKEVPASSKNGMATRSGDANCVVSSGTRIEGDFSATENVRLDGSLKGTLKCDKRLVVGEKGQVEGQVMASEAVIMGTITGDVKISGSLQLRGTAKIYGDITAKHLVVEEGATYNGQCKVGN